MDLFIYGAGGVGKEIADIAGRRRAASHCWERIRYVDDVRSEAEAYGLEVLRLADVLARCLPGQFVIAQGEPAVRARLHEALVTSGQTLTSLVDPGATVSPTAQLAPGCIIYPGAHVSSDASVGCNALVQFNTVVGHDIVIGAHAVVSSGVMLGGGCHIGEGSFVGMGASVKEQVTVGHYAVVGMGATVFADLGDELIALGNPARAVRRNETRRVFGK